MIYIVFGMVVTYLILYLFDKKIKKIPQPKKPFNGILIRLITMFISYLIIYMALVKIAHIVSGPSITLQHIINGIVLGIVIFVFYPELSNRNK